MKKKEEKLMKPKFSLGDLERLFPSEQSCIDYLEKVLWNNQPVCPFCSNSNSEIYNCKNNRYKCKLTGKYFNVKTRTIFENTKLPLKTWFKSFYLFGRKKGNSSLGLAKELGISQRSAWFVSHRIREVADCSLFKVMLDGFVEVDEVYMGGSNPNRHWDKKVPRCQGRSWKDKVPMIVIAGRNSNVIVQVVPNAERKTLEPIIEKYVKKGANVSTDEWLAYNRLSKWYNHQRVIHRIGQFVNGWASTNLAENFNSHLKRGIYGTYHWISRKHSQRYADEFAFRYNTRKYSEQEKLDLMLLSSVGKRLTYKELTS